MLNKYKTCSTLSEEVGFAALRLCLVIPLWSKCTVLQQNMCILLQGRAVMFYRAVTPSQGVEGQGVKTTDFIAWDHKCRNFSKFDCEILFSGQITLFGFCSVLVFLVVYIDFSCEVWKSLSCVHSLQPHGVYSLWNSPGQNTGMGAIPFSRIFSTQGSIPGLLQCKQVSLQAEPPEKPFLTRDFSYRILLNVTVIHEVTSIETEKIALVPLKSWPLPTHLLTLGELILASGKHIIFEEKTHYIWREASSKLFSLESLTTVLQNMDERNLTVQHFIHSLFIHYLVGL